MPDAPPAEVDIDDRLVHALLTDQHPDLARRPLRLLGQGWDNVLYRLGDDLTIRLPRRELSAGLVVHEQRWLPALAPDLPLPIPAPVRVGRPGRGFPWSWSVQPWFDGAAAGSLGPHRPVTAAQWSALATDLGRFLAALHRPAPGDAPENPYRGGPLAERDATTRARLIDVFADHGPATTPPPGADDAGPLAPLPNPAELAARWARAVAQPPWDGPAMWLHGDLHAHNVVVHAGVAAAVIDFGDITAGDPATDLALAFALFDNPDDRNRFQAAADTQTRPIDDAMWSRAEGWAVSVGLAVLDNSADSPAMYRMARAMIATA